MLRDQPLLGYLIAAALAIGLSFICSLGLKVLIPESPSMQTLMLGAIAAVIFRLLSRWLVPAPSFDPD